MKLSLHLFCPQLPKLDERAFIPGGACLQVNIDFREIESVLRLYGRSWESPASRMVAGPTNFRHGFNDTFRSDGWSDSREPRNWQHRAGRETQLWNQSHKTTYSVFDLDFLACGLAERAQIRIHGAGLADDEARHEAENGIVDLAVLDDADRSAAG
jgi:hypothetical protein